MAHTRLTDQPRVCTCPDDERPRPCQQRYALADCHASLKSLRRIDYAFPHVDVSERQEPGEEFSESARILRLQYQEDRRIHLIVNPPIPADEIARLEELSSKRKTDNG